MPEATAPLIDELTPSVPDIEVRNQMARAIGMGGITRNMVPQIFGKLTDVSLKADAELALILGADADTAARAVATYNDTDVPAEAIEELKDVYNKTFGYWSDRNYETGDVARWVGNAEAIAHVKVHDQLQDWPRIILGRNLVESIEIDNGPHSMTRVQLRGRLLSDAQGNERGEARGGDSYPQVRQGKGRLDGAPERARAPRGPGETGVLRSDESKSQRRERSPVAQRTEAERHAAGYGRVERHAVKDATAIPRRRGQGSSLAGPGTLVRSSFRARVRRMRGADGIRETAKARDSGGEDRSPAWDVAGPGVHADGAGALLQRRG